MSRALHSYGKPSTVTSASNDHGMINSEFQEDPPENSTETVICEGVAPIVVVENDKTAMEPKVRSVDIKTLLAVPENGKSENILELTRIDQHQMFKGLFSGTD